jgi:hypothetical protein
MRFSVKWLLVATADVALAAAAFRLSRSYLDAALWTVTTLAACYALFVCFATRFRQAFALGFVSLFALNVAGLSMFPRAMPSVQVIELCGYNVFSNGPDETLFMSEQNSTPKTTRAVDAACTMAASILGGALAILAYKRHGQGAAGSHN